MQGVCWLSLGAVLVATTGVANADDLYKKGNWAAMASDRRATSVGDLITVVVYQSASSHDVEQRSQSKKSNLGGNVQGGSFAQSGGVSLSGGYDGRGETRRTSEFVAQLSVAVDAVLPNGDLLVSGHQRLKVNGEMTDIAVRGRIRSADIDADNRILSTKIADAEIDYDGKGFVTRSARPGLIGKLFDLFGLL